MAIVQCHVNVTNVYYKDSESTVTTIGLINSNIRDQAICSGALFVSQMPKDLMLNIMVTCTVYCVALLVSIIIVNIIME